MNIKNVEFLSIVIAQIGIIFWIVLKTIIVFHFKFSIIENTHGWNGIDPIFRRKALVRIKNWNKFILFISMLSIKIFIELLDWISNLIKNKADEIKLTRK